MFGICHLGAPESRVPLRPVKGQRGREVSLLHGRSSHTLWHPSHMLYQLALSAVPIHMLGAGIQHRSGARRSGARRSAAYPGGNEPAVRNMCEFTPRLQH